MKKPAWIAVGLGAALIALAAGLVIGGIAGGDDSDANTVEVNALWYGVAKNGSVVGGVTPVGIEAAKDDRKTPLSVDLGGLRAAGAGPQWTAATAVAGAQALLISGVDPRTRQLDYTLGEAIDGPSAGGLLSAGSLAAIRGSAISDSTTMTGTVLPDGSVGPVSGVAEKIRAAAEDGFTRILIPRGLSEVLDDKTGDEVDPVKLGRSLGVDVTPVKNVPDAYALMTGRAEEQSEPKAPPIKAGIPRMLERRSRALIAATDQSESAHVAALVRGAERALAHGDPVLAFAAAAEGALAARLSEDSARLRAAAKRTSLGELKAQISRGAERSYASIRARMERFAELPVTKVAQLTALADTLSWGDFALTSIRVAQERLKTARTMGELDEIVGFLTVARFEAATYMPACAESLRYLGKQRITDIRAIVDRLNAYTDLIAYAADSNRLYAKSIGLGRDKDSFLAQLIEQSDGLTGWVSRQFPQLRGPTGKPALQMSVALLEYVETTQLVNNLTLEAGRGTDAPPNLIPINDPSMVRTQARTAGEIARREVHTIAAAGLDPSFVRWNSRWGSDLAFGRLPQTTDEQKLHGLEFQWFAVLQSRLLTDLSRLQQNG